jgi:O-antigen ligase
MNFRYATHSTYINFLFNMGMIGLCLFLVTTVNVVRTARAALPATGAGEFPYLAALIFAMFNILVAITFGDLYSPWIFVWATCGAALRIAVEVRVSVDEKNISPVVSGMGWAQEDLGGAPAVRSRSA